MARPRNPRATSPAAPPGARYIALNTGRFVLLDEEDYERLSGYAWLEAGGRAYRTDGAHHRVFMHREILGFPDGEVDHMNRDPLDNRRANLRPATHSQNASNALVRATNKAGFKGVSRDWTTGRWRAELHANKRHVFLGRFGTAEEAARAYDAAARQLQGAFARLNFPGPGENAARI